MTRAAARLLAACGTLAAVGAAAAMTGACLHPNCADTATCSDPDDGSFEDRSVADANMKRDEPDVEEEEETKEAAADAIEFDDAEEAGGADAADAAEEPAPESCTCTAPAPSGWFGPGAFFKGDADAALPGCAAPYPNDWATFNGGTMSSPAADCACQCGITPNADACTSPMITVYSDSQCNVSCGPSTGTGCSPNCSSGGNSARVTSPSMASTSTDACPISAALTNAGATPAWQFAGETCMSARTFPADECDAGLVCAPLPPSGFLPQLCIWQQADLDDCSTAGQDYSLFYKFYESYTDGRSCGTGTCQCDASNIYCTLSATTSTTATGSGSSATCGGTIHNLSLLDGGCNTQLSDIEGITTTVTPTGSCTPSGTAAPMGSFAPAAPVTVCCAQ